MTNSPNEAALEALEALYSALRSVVPIFLVTSGAVAAAALALALATGKEFDIEQNIDQRTASAAKTGTVTPEMVCAETAKFYKKLNQYFEKHAVDKANISAVTFPSPSTCAATPQDNVITSVHPADKHQSSPKDNANAGNTKRPVPGIPSPIL